jgi:recombination protein RecA
MPSLTAALLKSQIEAQLAHRIPAALSPMAREEAERQPLHDPRLTELLGGGVPVGGITEIHGEACSGRTSVALSLAAAVTAAERVVAWVDVSDELDPETAALFGVDLEQLLWVRCGKPEEDKVPASAVSPSGKTDLGIRMENTAPGSTATEPNLVATSHTPRPVGNGGCGSPHPRGEGRGMAEAIDALLQQQPRSAAIPDRRALKKIGTPGMPNRDVVQAMKPQSVSHHVAMVLGKAAKFPTGKPGGSTSNLVPPDEIVPTGSSLFGRQVERKVSCGSNRLPSAADAPIGSTRLPPTHRPPMPFPNASPYREEQIPTDRQPSRRAQPVAPQKAKPRQNLQGLNAPATRRKDDAEDLWAPLDQALRSVDLLLQAGGFSLLVLDLSSLPADKVWRIPLATWFRFRAGCERSRGSLVVLSQHPCARASADLTVSLRRKQLHTEGDRILTGSSVAVEL